MEVPAGHQGTVTELHVSVGDLLNEGAVIGTLTESAAVTTTESTAQSAPQDDQGGLVEPRGAIFQRYRRPPCRWATGVQILVPDMGDIDEVEVIEVAAQPGTSVNPGDLLVVLESDKASMEIPIEVGGMLLEISVAVGDQVSAGSLLATARVEIQQAPVAQTAAQPEPARQPVHAAEPLQNAEPTQVASTSLPQRTDSDATVYAGPTRPAV